MTLAASLYLVARRPGAVRRRRRPRARRVAGRRPRRAPRRDPPRPCPAPSRPCCCTSRCSRRSWPGCCRRSPATPRCARCPGPVAAERIGDGGRRRRVPTVRRGRRARRHRLDVARRDPRRAASTASRSPSPRSTSGSWEKVAEVVEGGLAFWPELPPQASSQCAGPDVAGQADTAHPAVAVGRAADGGAARRRPARRRHHREGQPGRRPRRAGRTGPGRADRGRTSGGTDGGRPHSRAWGAPLALLVASGAAIVGMVLLVDLLHRHRRDAP